MIPHVVVDVGNSRIKWGRCREGTLVEVAAMAHHADDWHPQFESWRDKLPSVPLWAIGGVVPQSIDDLVGWVDANGGQSLVIRSYRQVPIRVDVIEPDSVGLDRLFSAVAARAHYPSGRLLVVDAGSAITINLVDQGFQGGAILPGLRTMAKSLQDYTAQLPLIDVDRVDSFPGRDTASNIRIGILTSTSAAIERTAKTSHCEHLILTGGDAETISTAIKKHRQVIPNLTLDGLRITAEAVP